MITGGKLMLMEGTISYRQGKLIVSISGKNIERNVGLDEAEDYINELGEEGIISPEIRLEVM